MRRALVIALAVAAITPGAGEAAAVETGWLHMEIVGIHGVFDRDYYVEGQGAIPSAVASQIPLNDAIDLDGVRLSVDALSDWWCTTLQTLPDGQTFTLLATTGGISGRLWTFGLDPIESGDTVDVFTIGHSVCGTAKTSVRIDYHESGDLQTVTATVVDSSPTPVTETTIGVDTAGPAETNQPVTLRASVDASSGPVTGSVAFHLAGPVGRVLCSGRSVMQTSASPPVATCTTTFSMGDRWPWDGATVRGSFAPDDPAQLAASDGIGGIGIRRGTTRTDVTAPAAPADPSAPLPLTATVTPHYTGPVTPSGRVAFFDHGSGIADCGAVPLLPMPGGTATAVCETRLAQGAHELTARYDGDDEFTGSDAAPLGMVAQPAPPASPPRSSGQVGPAPPTRVVHRVSRRVRLRPHCHRSAHRRSHATRTRRCTTIRAR